MLHGTVETKLVRFYSCAEIPFRAVWVLLRLYCNMRIRRVQPADIRACKSGRYKGSLWRYIYGLYFLQCLMFFTCARHFSSLTGSAYPYGSWYILREWLSVIRCSRICAVIIGAAVCVCILCVPCPWVLWQIYGYLGIIITMESGNTQIKVLLIVSGTVVTCTATANEASIVTT